MAEAAILHPEHGSASARSSAAPPAPSVEIVNAIIEYQGRVLFAGLDVTLEAGRTTCLLGPSGIGKTTLLRLIAGLGPRIPAGRVRAGDGRPLAGRTAYMDQGDLLLPWLSALDNVALGSRLRGDTTDTDRAHALLERVGLADHGDDRPATLSAGMRQRVALARTLMEDRPVVLMDEPFSALDALTRMDLQDLAAELLRERTVVLVTHDPVEALRLGHRLLLMTGRPATLSDSTVPLGAPPRDPTASDVGLMHRDLLRRLGVWQRPSRAGAPARIVEVGPA